MISNHDETYRLSYGDEEEDQHFVSASNWSLCTDQLQNNPIAALVWSFFKVLCTVDLATVCRSSGSRLSGAVS